MVVGGGSVDGLAESFASGVDSAGGAWNSVGGVEDSAGRAAGSAGGAGDSVGGGVICILMCPWQRPAELGLILDHTNKQYRDHGTIREG